MCDNPDADPAVHSEVALVGAAVRNRRLMWPVISSALREAFGCMPSSGYLVCPPGNPGLKHFDTDRTVVRLSLGEHNERRTH
jgi:hypothetical protein